MVNIDINKIGNKLSRKFSGNLESISKLGDKIGDKINENLENINKLSDKISNKLNASSSSNNNNPDNMCFVVDSNDTLTNDEIVHENKPTFTLAQVRTNFIKYK